MFCLKKSSIFSIALIVSGLFSFIFSTNSIEAKMKKEPTIQAQPGGRNAWTKPAGNYGEHGEGIDSNESNSNESNPDSSDPNDDPWHPDHDPWAGDLPPLDHDPWPNDPLTGDD